MGKPLKAPFPYFGGKSRVARVVWDAIGPVDNYIEPFYGSGAVLLLRPDPPRIETVNDLDCYVANFWRATQHDPEAVAAHADVPVNEVDLHARHRWLVLSEDAAEFRKRMRADPEHFDAKVAGWWCWGLCCWIGSGWCATNGPSLTNQIPLIGDPPRGVHGAGLGDPKSKVRIAAHNEGSYGKGVHAKGQDLRKPRPNLNGTADGAVSNAGVHNDRSIMDSSVGNRAARRAWLLDWFGRLRDRLRNVRVCCGDWLRVCDSESVTTRLGTTGIFFDPPYGEKAGRNMKLYAQDSGTVAEDVRRYCLERGADPAMRIVLAGYVGEGHEELEAQGWRVEAWQAPGGYGNRSAKGKENAKKERLWISPHCQRETGLFDAMEG